jgi:hypothetical protein
MVTSCKEDADAPRTELSEQVADGFCIVRRDRLLVIAIRCADRLWDGPLRLAQDELEPVQVWLIRIRGSCSIGDVGRRAACDVVRARRRVGH